MRRSTIAAALLAMGAAPVFADESGLYLGVGVGQFNVEVDDVDTADDIQQAFDSDDTVYKVFAGWRFAPFFAVELDYIDLGGPGGHDPGCKL